MWNQQTCRTRVHVGDVETEPINNSHNVFTSFYSTAMWMQPPWYVAVLSYCLQYLAVWLIWIFTNIEARDQTAAAGALRGAEPNFLLTTWFNGQDNMKLIHITTRMTLSAGLGIILSTLSVFSTHYMSRLPSLYRFSSHWIQIYTKSVFMLWSAIQQFWFIFKGCLLNMSCLSSRNDALVYFFLSSGRVTTLPSPSCPVYLMKALRLCEELLQVVAPGLTRSTKTGAGQCSFKAPSVLQMETTEPFVVNSCV